MIVKYVFKTISFCLLGFFSIKYFETTTNMVIDVSGDIPQGYDKSQWDNKIKEVLLEPSFNSYERLRRWLSAESFEGSMTVKRVQAGKLSINITLDKFDLIINNTICLKQNGTVSNFPCFYDPKSVGIITVPQKWVENIDFKKQFLVDIMNLDSSSYYFKISAFGYADFWGAEQLNCRVSLYESPVEQIKICKNEVLSYKENQRLDLSLNKDILTIM